MPPPLRMSVLRTSQAAMTAIAEALSPPLQVLSPMRWGTVVLPVSTQALHLLVRFSVLPLILAMLFSLRG